MATVVVNSSANVNSTITSVSINYTFIGRSEFLFPWIDFNIFVNNTLIKGVRDTFAPNDGTYTKTLSLTTTDQAEMLVAAYGKTLTNCVKVEVTVAEGMTEVTGIKIGNLTILHLLTNLDTTAMTLPINLNTSPLCNVSWTKPTISGLPADAFLGGINLLCNNVYATTIAPALPANTHIFKYLDSTEIATIKSLLGAYKHGDYKIELRTYFKTGASEWSACVSYVSDAEILINGWYEPKTLTITSAAPNFTETGSITVTWTGMEYYSDTINLYLIINGSTMSKVVSTVPGATSASYSLGTAALENELYGKAANYDFVDAVQLQINEYIGGSYYTYASKTGGYLTLSRRLTSFGVSTAEPLNLDAQTNIISSWVLPNGSTTFYGALDIYVNDVYCAGKSGYTGVNEAITVAEKNNMIAAMNEVSPATLKYILTTQFDTGTSWTSLPGTQTITKTNQLIKIFYFESTGTLTPFTVSSSLTSIPYTLTIDPRNPANINHTLVLKVNGVTITTETGILTSGNLTINAGMRTAILNACPTLTNTATLDITTYMGEEFVDTVTTAAVIVTIGTEYQPSISALTHTELVAWVNTFAGGYLRTKSTIGFTFTETPSLGATVSSYTVIYNEVEFTLSTNSITVPTPTAGSISVSGRITDTRGRTATINIANIIVKDYTVPSLTNVDVNRAVYEEGAYRNDTLGTYCHYQFTASVCSILNGSTQVNELRYRLGYKIKGTADYTYYTEVDTGTISLALEHVYKDSYDADEIYEVVVEVHDLAYSDIMTVIVTEDQLPKALVCMLWGDNVVSVGKIWEQGTLDVGGDIYALNQKVLTEASLIKKNWIINGGFDIWQRNTAQSASGIYSDDRWGNMYSGSSSAHSRQTFTPGQTDVPNNPKYYSRTVVTSVTGASNYVSKSQLIEDVTLLAGKNVSISFWAKADASKSIAIEFYQYFGATSGFVTAIGSQKFALTTSWQRFTATVAIPSSSGKTVDAVTSYLALRFWFNAGSTYNANSATLGQQAGTFEIANVSLVEGSYAQEWQTEAYADALRACQRYYCLISSLSGAGNSYEQMGIGSADSTTSVNVSVNLPITMRVPPTVIDYALPFRVHNGGAAFSVTSMSIQTIFTSNNKVGVACVSSEMTTNNFYTLSRNNSTSATLGFGAEL